MRRVAIYTVVALVLAIGGAALAIDGIARSAIESGVETALGVPAQVGSVRLRLLVGSFRMDDLEIANPAGYEADYFARLGKVETRISYVDLRVGNVVLERLVLEDLDLDLEWQGLAANYQVILQDEEPASESETRFIIDELVVRNVTARLSLKSPLGSLATEQLEIPEIRLAGVGRKDGGIGLARLVLEVTESVVGAVLKQRGTFSPRIGSGSTREKLEDAGKKLLEGFGPFKKRK